MRKVISRKEHHQHQKTHEKLGNMIHNYKIEYIDVVMDTYLRSVNTN